ncbi:MAG: DNA polymerase III subunit gamma/tau [Planctomycetota bacterium]
MSHVAYARKYRPRTFEEVVGQSAIAEALRNQVARERTAPAYLFSGTHGVGKTSMARIFAKALNCPKAQEGRPCLECDVCQSIDRGEALDVIEIDAASNRGVDDAERIRQNTRYRPQGSRFKVYILDEVHQLSRVAFDALLKTFEEAPEHVRFVLATTELHKVPTTIRSRAQVFNFRQSTRQDLEARLGQIAEQEGLSISPAALALVARRARGSMRDAQKLLDQVVTLGEAGQIDAPQVAELLGALTGDAVDAVLSALIQGEAGTLLECLDAYLSQGGRVTTFLEELQDALRAALYLKTCGADSPLVQETGHAAAALQPVAEGLALEALLLCLQLLEETSQRLRLAREPRVVLEVTLARLARARELRPIGELLTRLERLEESLGGGGVGAGPAPAPTPGGGGSRGPQGGPPPRGPQTPPSAPPKNPTSTRGSTSRGAAPARQGYDYPGRPQQREEPARAEWQGEVASAPAAKAAPAAVATQRSPDEAFRWTLDELRAQGGLLPSMLEKMKPQLRPDGDELVLVLSASPMLFGQIESARNQEILSGLMQQAMGQPVRLRLERLEPRDGPGAPGAAGGGGSSVYEEPLVKFAQRELGAQIMQK